jgi:FkbM family methyltransferase
MDLGDGQEGCIVKLNPRSDSPEALMWDVIVNAVRYTPQPGDWVLDIGAHHGIFALYCAARGAHVRAYEPETENFRELERQRLIAESLGCPPMEIINSAVWSESGTRFLWINPENSGASCMVKSVGFGERIDVRAVSIEEALQGRIWDCVKVDVEGAEWEIFARAKPEHLSRMKYLTMELHNHILTQERHDELIAKLKSGFTHAECIPECRNGQATGRISAAFCRR